MALLRNLLLSFAFTWAHAAVTPLDSSVQVRNAPGHSVEDTYHAIKRGLALASLEKRDSFKAEPMNIARSWSGATLLSVALEPNPLQEHENGTTTVEAGIEVTCRKCYVKGVASAELTIDGEFDAGELLNSTINSVSTAVRNFTDRFEEKLGDEIEHVMDNFTLSDGIDSSDFKWPTFDLAFDLNVPTIDAVNLHLQFDGMELYLEIGTVLNAGATYEITLFATQTPVGMKIGPNLMLGAVLSIDLILAVEGAIDISTGFHVKLDDGVAIDLPLFGNEVADMTVNGGQFEFLPVTLESASITMQAALRIGAHCGLEVVMPEPPPGLGMVEKLSPQVEAGIEVAIYANIAEFNTNVTYAADDEDCKLKVIQEYNFAVGAIAGASVAVEWFNETKTWGPVAEASTAIFTTTMAEVCGMQGKPTPAPTITPGPERREDLTPTTISTEITRSGVSCKIQGPANCPNSQQVTTTTKFSSTTITSVAPGVEATWPAETSDAVDETVAFGTQAKTMRAVSGKPTPYVAPPDEDGNDDVHDLVNGSTGGVSNKVIIGVCVGLVLPILIAIIGAVM
ncbi:hypothetical protein J4E93_009987 [Alternaria ventricosa]|uniref:uncharacterized protein n=1 Tax=Alternaria ventricosa TaxID=1187951 RepID=UPI0020C52810|nr:uncharacterized protein J4E93_009987 [Alternaria ventricosa]KAI4638434.1 hypothetical protein J4E93_009987 [Alternaria ventricosa]